MPVGELLNQVLSSTVSQYLGVERIKRAVDPTTSYSRLTSLSVQYFAYSNFTTTCQ